MGLNKDIFMLCNPVSEETALKMGDNWKANIKYDGERVMAIKRGREVVLLNRRGSIVNAQFSEVVEQILKIDIDVILDGEVVAQAGKFNELQRRALTKNPIKREQLRKEIPVKYVAFDILEYGGKNLIAEPLRVRVNYLYRLTEVLLWFEIANYGSIEQMLKIAKEHNLEGIVIKNMSASYESKRSSNCLKLKLWKELTTEVNRYEENNAGIKLFSIEGYECQCSGEQSRAVKSAIDCNGKAIVELQYLEKTKDGKLRFPSFRGLK